MIWLECFAELQPHRRRRSGVAIDHADLLKPPKPTDWPKDFLSLWRIVCMAVVVCIFGWPLLMMLSVDSSLDIRSPWEVPEIRQLFSWGLIGLAVTPVGFLVVSGTCLGVDWLSRQLAQYLNAVCVCIRWVDHSLTCYGRRIVRTVRGRTLKPEMDSAL